MSHAYFEGLPLPEPKPSAPSWLRRVAAMIVLCMVGMLVVSSLFASPAQRTSYRQANGGFIPTVRTAASPANVAPRTGKRSASDHC